MEKNLGKVLDGAKINEFNFVCRQPVSDEFIVAYGTFPNRSVTTIIGRVVDIIAINRYFTDVNAIQYIDEENQELHRYTVFKAQVQCIANIIDNKVVGPTTPPNPGTNVYAAPVSVLHNVLGSSTEGIHIGSLASNPDVPIRFAVDRLLRTHLAIIGHTGSGKSWLAKVIARELTEKNHRKVIIFDPANEYKDIISKINAQYISTSEFRYPLDLSFLGTIFSLSPSEKVLLGQSLRHSMSQLQLPISSDTKLEISSSKRHSITTLEIAQGLRGNGKVVNSVRSKLAQIELQLSNTPTNFNLQKSTIFHIAGTNSVKQQIALRYCLDHIISLRTAAQIPPLLLIIEEAHNYVPSLSTSLCKSDIIYIARQGRKLGLSLCLVTQRPRHVDPTVLSQCGNMFLFRMQNVDDVDHVLSLSPVSNPNIRKKLFGLWIGECLALGDILNFLAVSKIKDYRLR